MNDQRIYREMHSWPTATEGDRELLERAAAVAGRKLHYGAAFTTQFKEAAAIAIPAKRADIAKHQEKILPGAVINAAVNERAKEIKERDRRAIDRKERQDLKDEILFSLLPRAFVKDRLDFAYIDTKEQRLIVNAASAKRAERLIHELRLAIGSLKCTPFECDRGAESLLTEWVRQGHADIPFTLGEECELKAPKDGRTIKAKKEDLSSDEIRAHLAAGLNVQKSSLLWGEDLTFVLGPDLSINRLKFQDVLREQAADRKPESVEEEFDATFFIMTETLRRFIADLCVSLMEPF